MAATGLRNHWTELPEWTPSRRLWALYVTLTGQPALHYLVRRYQRELRALPGLDMIARDDLHMTIQGIAFNDQVDGRQVDDVARAVNAVIRTQELPTLMVQEATLDNDAVALPVFPAGQIHGIRALLRDTVRDVLGGADLYRLPEPANGFAPHVSVAYANRTVPHADILRRLERVAHVPTAMTVSHLSLISLVRGDRRWSWDSERPLAFAQSPSSVPTAQGLMVQAARV